MRRSCAALMFKAAAPGYKQMLLDVAQIPIAYYQLYRIFGTAAFLAFGASFVVQSATAVADRKFKAANAKSRELKSKHI